MLKLIIPVLMLASFNVFAEGVKHKVGRLQQIDVPFTVAGNIIERAERKDVIYWFIPLDADEEGITDATTFLKSFLSGHYIRNPFVFKFRVAGILPLEEVGDSLKKDNLAEELLTKIDGLLTPSAVMLRCNGLHVGYKVPSCYVYDQANMLVNGAILDQALAFFDPDLGLMDAEVKNNLSAAEDAAKSRRLGVWEPYSMMFRGL